MSEQGTQPPRTGASRREAPTRTADDSIDTRSSQREDTVVANVAHRTPAEKTAQGQGRPPDDPPASSSAPSSADDLLNRKRTPAQRVQHILHRNPALSPLIVLVLALIVFGVVAQNFLRPQALSLLVQQMAVVGALAVGQPPGYRVRSTPRRPTTRPNIFTRPVACNTGALMPSPF